VVKSKAMGGPRTGLGMQDLIGGLSKRWIRWKEIWLPFGGWDDCEPESRHEEREVALWITDQVEIPAVI
jgi:hypothetical protein